MTIRCLAALAMLMTPLFTIPTAQAQELEAQLASTNAIGGLAGGAIGGLAGPLAPTPQLNVGFAIDERVLITAGIAATFATSTEGDDYSSTSVTIPIGVKLYLATPEAERVVPMLRFGAAIGQTWADLGGSTIGFQHVSAQALAGAAYFMSDALALTLEGGLNAAHPFGGAQLNSVLTVSVVTRLGLTLRL